MLQGLHLLNECPQSPSAAVLDFYLPNISLKSYLDHNLFAEEIKYKALLSAAFVFMMICYPVHNHHPH